MGMGQTIADDLRQLAAGEPVSIEYRMDNGALLIIDGSAGEHERTQPVNVLIPDGIDEDSVFADIETLLYHSLDYDVNDYGNRSDYTERSDFSRVFSGFIRLPA